MCENTYVACGGCNAPATSVRAVDVYDRREHSYRSLDENGEQVGDWDYEDDCDSQLAESYFECEACSWRGQDLDMECSPDDCECDGCVEPDPEDEGPDPDRIVMLLRESDERVVLDANVPAEIARLLTDRTIDRLPLPRWRATELYAEWVAPLVRRGACFRIIFSDPHPALMPLMLDYEDKEVTSEPV